MKEDPELRKLLDAAKKAWQAMTPEQQEAHLKAQRESWARGEIALSECERAHGHHTTVTPLKETGK